MDISEKVKKKESVMLAISFAAVLGLGLAAVFAVSKNGLVSDVLEHNTPTASVSNVSVENVDITIVPIEG
ncbi:MAG: hypothetical protein KAS07_05020 [Candidatus Pacebacteria bacterium]|nr:hypothetical protein [Candidatus Paceibacterota bacterium]